jgi:hypothetical protein
LIAKLTNEPEKPPGLASHLTDVLSQSVTLGAVVVAYHMFQSIPMDYGKIAILAIVGGIAWSLVGHFVPKKRDRGLEGMVRDALAPMAAKKPSKKAQETDAAKEA